MSNNRPARQTVMVHTQFIDVTKIIGPIVHENLRVEFVETMVEVAKEKSPVDTGNNRASISYLVGNKGTFAIGTTSGYGAYLELGTRVMAARPYFLPAAEEAKKTVQMLSMEAWQP
jgi:hypothetical protein